MVRSASTVSCSRSAHAPASSASAASMFRYVFDAATERSTPAASGSNVSAALASSEAGSFVKAIVRAPCARARST